VLHGDGSLLAFGGAPRVTSTNVHPGRLTAAAAVRTADAGGYVLEDDGTIHPFGDASAASSSATFPGWAVAHDIVTGPDGGLVLDACGRRHPFSVS